MEITYASIKPIIRKEELVNGNQVNIEFCAKNQETALQTVAIIMANQSEMNKNIAKTAGKSIVKNSLISIIAGFFGSLVGGAGGSVVRSATNTAGSAMVNKNNDPNALLRVDITPERKEKAIVDAFLKVQSMYSFNDNTSEWQFITTQV